MKYDNFKMNFLQIKEATSQQGKIYSNIYVSGSYIYYTRESGSREEINMFELFEAYSNEPFINTTILRNYITGRKYSPSLAILKAAGLYDYMGKRVTNPVLVIETENSAESKTDSQPLSAVIPKHKLEPVAKTVAQYLEQKFKKPARFSLEYSSPWLTAIPDKNVLKDYWLLVKDVYAELVDHKFDLDKQIELINKPGKQLFDIWFDEPYLFAVEFDEDQHFNQFRGGTLKYYRGFDCDINLSDYEQYCSIIKNPGTSGFQKLKSHDPLFPEMLPGIKQDNRIRQRAFRDFLKDITPLANGYGPTVRIPFQITNKKKNNFDNSDLSRVSEYLAKNNFIN
jgi:hypothetical protein